MEEKKELLPRLIKSKDDKESKDDRESKDDNKYLLEIWDKNLENLNEIKKQIEKPEGKNKVKEIEEEIIMMEKGRQILEALLQFTSEDIKKLSDNAKGLGEAFMEKLFCLLEEEREELKKLKLSDTEKFSKELELAKGMIEVLKKKLFLTIRAPPFRYKEGLDMVIREGRIEDLEKFYQKVKNGKESKGEEFKGEESKEEKPLDSLFNLITTANYELTETRKTGFGTRINVVKKIWNYFSSEKREELIKEILKDYGDEK